MDTTTKLWRFGRSHTHGVHLDANGLICPRAGDKMRPGGFSGSQLGQLDMVNVLIGNGNICAKLGANTQDSGVYSTSRKRFPISLLRSHKYHVH